MNNYLGSLSPLTVTAPSAATTSAPLIVGGTFIGIPMATADSGAEIALVTEGRIRLAKVSAAIAGTPHTAAEALTLGQDVYWDVTNSKVTSKALGIRIGKVALAAASSATTVDVAFSATLAGNPSVAYAVGYYDFAVQGGTISTVNLVGSKVPSGAFIKSVLYKVITTFTSATDAGTIALGIATDSTGGLKTAVAISNGANPWDAGAFNAALATPVGATGERFLTATFAVEAITAGKMVVIAEYILPGTFA